MRSIIALSRSVMLPCQHILHFLAQVIQLVGKEHMVIEIQNGGQLVPILSKKDMVVDFRMRPARAY